MSLNFFQIFQPKDKNFFPLFEKASANLVETAKVLVELTQTSNAAERGAMIKQIEDLEHVGDAITHETFHELSANFITPFDRDDIHQLVSKMDDILDFIHGSSKRLQIYQVHSISPAMIQLAYLIQEGVEVLHTAVCSMRFGNRKIKEIKEALVKINSVENRADDVYDSEIAKLFRDEKDAIELIKMKEILASLETATDKCEDVANIIESIIVKNA